MNNRIAEVVQRRASLPIDKRPEAIENPRMNRHKLRERYLNRILYDGAGSVTLEG